jgi:thioredoxin 1
MGSARRARKTRVHAAQPQEFSANTPRTLVFASFPTLFDGQTRGEYPVNPSIAHVSDDQFEEQVLKSSEPVLVDFWAEWCGPCKMIAPILDDVATNYAGKLRVAKINIDHNQKTPRNYNVRGIPTLMIFKDGKVQATQIGAISKTQLTQLIDKTLANAQSVAT